MKGLYENVLLGTFIFRLGYKMGELGKLKDTPFSPNLFQQTPLDRVFRDFVGMSGARGFMLELKKNWEGRLSELAKKKCKLLNENSELAKLAEKCHLLGFGKEISYSLQSADIANPSGLASAGVFDIVFCKYLQGVSATAEEELKISWAMSDFLQEIADDKIGASLKEFCDYIRIYSELLLKKLKAPGLQLTAKANLRDLTSAEGSVAVLNTGGAFYAVPFSSIIDLGASLNIPAATELSREMSRTMGGPPRGPSRGGPSREHRSPEPPLHGNFPSWNPSWPYQGPPSPQQDPPDGRTR